MNVQNVDEYIFQIIERQDIANQDQLLEELSKHDIRLPQATLSRRLHKLGISKIHGTYRLITAPSAGIDITQVDIAPPNLLVLHTRPGFANAVGFQLNQQRDSAEAPFDGILGTIAGDDTVLVVVSNHNTATSLKQKLESMAW